MHQDRDLKCLDELIAQVGGVDIGMRSEGPCGSLSEHLRAARQDLMGSMPGEYKLSLELAKGSVACIVDKDGRTKVKKTLQGLMDSESAQR